MSNCRWPQIERIDHCMEGEGRRLHSRSGKGEKADLDPGRIQEYDFFVTPDGFENQDTPEADRPTRVRKKRGRKKGTMFFVSD
jgi:hypothetical protein